jgi:hypothetical protein
MNQDPVMKRISSDEEYLGRYHHMHHACLLQEPTVPWGRCMLLFGMEKCILADLAPRLPPVVTSLVAQTRNCACSSFGTIQTDPVKARLAPKLF